MADNFALVPFEDHQIMTVANDDGIFVVMKPVVESLGLHWGAQHQRINRHPAIAKGIFVTKIPSAGGVQEVLTLELEKFHGWLVTISPDRIADPTIRATILRYQERAFRVIFEHFHGPIRRISTRPASVAEYLRVGNALKTERDRRLRCGLWLRLDQICDSWNIPRIPHDGIGFADPDPAEILTDFWGTVTELAELGHVVNQSRRNDLFAIHMPSLIAQFREIGCEGDINPTLMKALHLSTAPRFDAYKAVNCADRTVRKCWVFSYAPPAPA